MVQRSAALRGRCYYPLAGGNEAAEAAPRSISVSQPHGAASKGCLTRGVLEGMKGVTVNRTAWRGRQEDQAEAF